jgi:hypothetical protein
VNSTDNHEGALADPLSIPVVIHGEKPSRQVVIENEAGEIVYRCFAPSPEVAKAMFLEWGQTQDPASLPDGQYAVRLAHPPKPKPDGGQIHA